MSGEFGPLEIQKAIFARLNGSAALRTALGIASPKPIVFDCVPQEQAFPFVVFSPQDVKDWDSHTFDGFESEVQIHTWVRSFGRAGAWNIMKEVYGLLHGYDLPVTGFSTVVCRCVFQTVLVEPDNVTYHGVQKIHIVIGES